VKCTKISSPPWPWPNYATGVNQQTGKWVKQKLTFSSSLNSITFILHAHYHYVRRDTYDLHSCTGVCRIIWDHRRLIKIYETWPRRIDSLKGRDSTVLQIKILWSITVNRQNKYYEVKQKSSNIDATLRVDTHCFYCL